MMSKFVRLTKTLVDKGILVKPEEVKNHIQNPEVDHYVSTYFYNDEQYKKFQETGSVKDIDDVKTEKLWFDFDSKEDQTLAQKDALEVIERLKKHNIDPKKLEIYFSGNKGFNIIVNLKREINPIQVKHLAVEVFGKGLQTLDVSLYNPSRILRVPGTKHQESGLYKLPLSYNQLKKLSINKIREMAQEPKNKWVSKFEWEKVDLDDQVFEVKEVKEEIKNKATSDFDLMTKPRNWKSSKWALMQGFFGSGERNQAMMVLAATCKAMGYDKITSYYMCKSALQKSWERHGQGNFSKEELWNNVIEIVFDDGWKGGQYSEKEDLYLQKKAEELGIKELTTTSTVDIKGALRIFKDFAKNINKLTLKTGIKEIDDRQRITVGMSFGLIAAPGVGKTTIALQMLHSMSKAGELCIFFSYDMYAPLIVQKIIQKHWQGDNIEQVFKKYEANDEEYVKKVDALIEKEYPNVEFCFDSAQSIDDVYRTLKDAEQKRGKKCKFIVIDYNELVITEVSDPTQSSNYVAQKVRELASKEQVCVLSLFQPSKLTGDPSTEIMSFRAAKGGSGIEQSVSLMFGVSRPGFNPRKPAEDNYLSINCVKNRMGPIFSIDLHWDGYHGVVRSLTEQERHNLRRLREQKEAEKNGKSSGEDGGWQ